MSEYNAKNYTEQGGDVTHIGGELIFDEGSSLKGGLVPNQKADIPGSDTVAKVRGSLNELITSLKDAGLMVGDDFVIAANHSVNDTNPDHADRSFNTSKIHDVYVDGTTIGVSLSVQIDELKDFDGGGGWGVHKWIGIGVSVGVTPITDLYFNGERLTQADVDEATAMGLDSGYFVLWIKAEKAFWGESNKFTLKSSGFKETEIIIRVGVPVSNENG